MKRVALVLCLLSAATSGGCTAPQVVNVAPPILPPPTQCQTECDAPCQPPAGVDALPLEDQARAILICREIDVTSLALCEQARRSCVAGWPNQ